MPAHTKLLCDYLERHGAALPSHLADHFDVSTRTIYNWINRANEELAGAARIERGEDGFTLVIDDAQAFAGRAAHGGAPAHQSVPATSDERVRYLLNDLLSRADWTTLDTLSSVLFVSRVSISKDLAKVEEVLASYGLALERKPYYGIRVTGPEFQRRICLASLASESMTGVTGGPTALFDRADLEAISACIETILKQTDIRISTVAYQNLIIHMAIALARIRENCYVPMAEEHLERIRGTHEFAVAHEIADEIERRLQVSLPDEEIAYIAIHLAGKRTLEELPGEGDEPALVITDEVWDLVARMLERVWQGFRFDFRNDLELRMNLAKHIAPMTVRLTFHIMLKNPLLAEVKERFPLAYSMACEAVTVLAERFGTEPSEEEIGYVAMSFALALERQAGAPEKHNILIVCASGQGSARLLAHRYRQEFGEHLDRIETCDVSEIDDCDLTDIDYVFTTVPLPHALPVPVREVRFFLDDRDFAAINELIADPDGSVPRHLDERLFLPHLSASTGDEAIDALTAHAARFERLPDGFADLVRERERLAPTAFGNRVAIPHPVRAVTERTFVVIGLADEPIDWFGQAVDAVFLISIAQQGEDDLHAFYHALLGVLIDEDAVATLLRERRFETLLALMRKQQEGKEHLS